MSQWADKYRKLSPESSAEPGQWRTARAPYQAGIMDAVNDPLVTDIAVMKPSQVGWTEILLNVAGYFIHYDPSPMLLVQPTLEMAKAFSKDRLAPMLRDTEVLRGKVKEARARDSDNTVLHKVFDGGHITIPGANSPASLASRPIRILLCDEVDRYPPSVGTEGDPVNLARKRTTTFWNRKRLMGSTPTIEGRSRIESLFGDSDQRHYFVPCPHCKNLQTLKWPQVKWPEGKPEEAYYVCEHCGAVITDTDKPEMLSRGEWRATKPFTGVAGFHLNELYSPWVSFAEMATAFLEAKKSPETLQTFINTALAETWKEQGIAPKWEQVAEHKQPYRSGEIPSATRAVLLTVDVQIDRFVYVVRGWGAGAESWLIEQGELWGETDKQEVWERLALLVQKKWGAHSLSRAWIDSGYRTDQVYAFCRRFPGLALPVKGKDRLDKPAKMTRIDISVRGITIKNGLQLWIVDTDYFKSWVHGRVFWPDDQPGAWHLPSDVTDDYCKQIVSESVIVSPNGKRTWVRHGNAANHYLDCEMMQAACAHVMQIHLIRPDGTDKPAGRRIRSKGINS